MLISILLVISPYNRHTEIAWIVDYLALHCQFDELTSGSGFGEPQQYKQILLVYNVFHVE